MTSKFLYIFIAFIVCKLFTPSISAQALPNYQERIISDSAAVMSNQFYSEGAVDESIDPDEYIVGPGDLIFISISGISETSLNVSINEEGYIYIPKVGGIDLRDLTLKKAKQKIKDEINKFYKDVDVFVSLSKFREIKVTLLGDVKRPFTYTVPANSRLMDLIVHSEGLSKTSSYRNIKITSKNGIEKSYDFLSFLRFGDKNENPLLHEGDIVLVDRVDKTVSISGEVKYPGTYEYVKGETAAHLIKLSGGLLSKARKDTIEIVRFNKDGKSEHSLYYSLNQLKNENIKLEEQDKIIVRKIPEYYIERYVRITGHVKYPGYYKIIKNKTTLKDVIEEAGGFLNNASLKDAVLTRQVGNIKDDAEYERLKTMQRKDMSDDEYAYLKAKSREHPGKVIVNFVGLFKHNDLNDNVILKSGDVITIPKVQNYITMLGQFVKPGNLIYKKGAGVGYYIKKSGGFGWRAESGDVRVIRATTGEWVDASDVDSLYPGDAIWAPESPPPPRFWDVFTTSLQVVGQVASIVAATVAIIVASRK